MIVDGVRQAPAWLIQIFIAGPVSPEPDLPHQLPSINDCI